jgi:hypothetical protein
MYASRAVYFDSFLTARAGFPNAGAIELEVGEESAGVCELEFDLIFETCGLFALCFTLGESEG